MKFSKRCVHCDIEYLSKKIDSKYCSRACKDAHSRTLKKGVCVICGCETRCERVKTCSKYCKSLYLKSKKETIEWKEARTEIICQMCNKTFIVSNSRKSRKCCSKKCAYELRSILYKGRTITPEWKANQNLGKKRENIVKFGDFECEKCHKKFETNLSLRSHKSYCSADQEQRNVTCEICGKVFKRNRNFLAHYQLHDEEKYRQHCLSVKEGVKYRSAPQTTSNQELQFYKILCDFYGQDNVVHKFKLQESGHEYDFYVKSLNLIIEFDGDYWHGNKECFELTDKMKQQFNIDISHTKRAIKEGYNLQRVWASKMDIYPNELRVLPI